MLTQQNDPTEVLQSFPDELQDFLLAVSIISKRIGSLPKADQNDLMELLSVRSQAADDEERREINRAMVEILTRAKVAVKPVPLPPDMGLPRGTECWAKHVGGKIRELRTKAGLTQSQLAEKADLPQSHISRLENAEYSATHHTLVKLAKALGVEVGSIDPCAP